MRYRSVVPVFGIAAVLMALLVACTASAPATPQATAAAVEVAATPAGAAAAEEPVGDQATLVIQLDENRTLVREVDFTAPVSGLALLEQSDLDVVKSDFSWGTAVCSIEGVGCPAEDCFCAENVFWNYLAWQDGAWASYPVGPAQSIISMTAVVEGWQWGTGQTPPLPFGRAETAHKALTWLRSQQVITDGSYAGSIGASVESLMAIGANHEDAARWRGGEDAPSLLDFVLEHGAEYSQEGVSESAKLAVALSAAEACWPVDALKPSDYYSPTAGTLHTDAGRLAWGILGTLALDEPLPAGSVEYLTNLALPEGGWEWQPEWGRDTNTTAVAVQALLAAGTPVTSSVVISALGYLQEAHAPEGGFSYDPHGSWGNVADSNSTGYVLQALAALGAQEGALQPMQEQAIAFLSSLQNEEGALGWQVGQPAPNMGATQQAIPGLLGQSYPIRRVALPVCER